jgi:hypothetical protein
MIEEPDNTKLNEVIKAFPQFFPSEELFIYGGAEHYANYIKVICTNIHTKINVYPDFIKMREPAKDKSRTHAKPPKGMYTFSFDQIKTKFGSARFYYSLKAKKFSELTEEEQELYDPDDYEDTVKKMMMHVRAMIDLCEAMADRYELIKL